MTKKRRSYEAGHSPKFMVVIDDSPECDRALYFASRRALRVGATVLMLRVIETRDRNQLAALVLAAATSKEGPGPLVSSLAKNAGDFPIPVAIVPGHLSDEQLEALS